MGKEIIFNDTNFQKEVLESPIPVVVDFWAPWCGPCLMMSPHIAQMAKEYAGKAKVGKLNVDENPKTTSQFEIISIPTVIIFKNGKAVDQNIGVAGKDAIEKKLDAVLE